LTIQPEIINYFEDAISYIEKSLVMILLDIWKLLVNNKDKNEK